MAESDILHGGPSSAKLWKITNKRNFFEKIEAE